MIRKLALTLATSVFSLSLAASAATAESPQSATVLEFADANTLFVADSDDAKIYAYTLPDAKPATKSRGYNLIGLGAKLAEQLNVDPFGITYHDVAVHPVSKETYISISVRPENKNPRWLCASIRMNPLRSSTLPIDPTHRSNWKTLQMKT